MLTLQPGRSYLAVQTGFDLVEIFAQFDPFDRVVTDAAELDVKTVRQLMASLNLASVNQRLFLVSNAHLLSDVSQNTLLKLIEEPPARLTIILQTDHSQRLLPTLLSRLHTFTVKPAAGPSVASGEFPELAFDRLAKLSRTELIEQLVLLLGSCRWQLLGQTSVQLAEKVLALDTAVQKLQANANQKLTLDWLLLRWSDH